MSGSDAQIERLLEILSRRFGSHTKSSSGARYFQHGLEWEPGIQLSWGHSANCCIVDLRGERLQVMEHDDVISTVVEVMQLGFRATRIDIAIDLIGQECQICDRAKKSCEEGELCVLRTYSPAWSYLSCGKVEGKILRLGSRQSPTFIRIYDKGLQTRTACPGEWERFEVEFKEDRAMSVLVEILGNPKTNLQTMSELALGAVDFRRVNGRSELRRRPRASWWAAFLDNLVPRRLKPIKASLSTFGWLDGFRRSYGSTILYLANEMDLPPESLFSWLVSGLTPSSRRPGLAKDLIALGLNGPAPYLGSEVATDSGESPQALDT